MVGELMKSDPRNGGEITNLYTVGQNTSRLLLGAGDLVVGWLLLRQAAVALDALAAGASGKDKDFYEGKVAAAQFYARQVLPRLSAERAIAEATDSLLMDVPGVRVLTARPPHGHRTAHPVTGWAVRHRGRRHPVSVPCGVSGGRRPCGRRASR